MKNQSFIYILLIIINIYYIKGCTDIPLAITYGYGCTYTNITITNAQRYVGLSIQPSASQSSDVNGYQLYQMTVTGSYVISYKYLDNDGITVCSGSSDPIPITIIQPSFVNPKCPWTSVTVTTTGTGASVTKPTISLNGDNSITDTQLTTSTPGTNYLQLVPTQPGGCQKYYFQVEPQTSSVPRFVISPTSCRKNDGKITVTNHSNYTSLSLVDRVSTTYQPDANGVFSSLPPSTFTLTAVSVGCGTQVIGGLALSVLYPLITATYYPLETCNIDSPQVNASFLVEGFPNAIIKQGNIILPAPLAQGTSQLISWTDSQSNCKGDDYFIIPQVNAPLSFKIDPPVSTLSNPSTVTVIYPRNNYSEVVITTAGGSVLELDQNHQFKLSTEIGITFTARSICSFSNQLITVPSLVPIMTRSPSKTTCLQNTTVLVANYNQYLNITLMLRSDLTVKYTSFNGTFPNLMATNYVINAYEKTTDGIVPAMYNQPYSIVAVPLDQSLFTVDYVVNQYASTCVQQGTVNITITYNNTVTVQLDKISYTPGTPLLLPFEQNQCQESVTFNPPNNLFNFNYSIDTTVHPETITFSGTTMNTLVINGISNDISPNIPLSRGINTIKIGYSDDCSYTFTVPSYPPIITPQPLISITPQPTSTCKTRGGAITVTNPTSFSLLTIAGQPPSSPFGTWSGLSVGIYVLQYKSVTSTTGFMGLMNVTVGIDSDTKVTTTITNQPHCKSTSDVNGGLSTDSRVKVVVSTISSNTELIINGYQVLTSPLQSPNDPQLDNIYYTPTREFIGLLPGLYSINILYYYCSWNVNFTINPILNITFPSISTQTNGVDQGTVNYTNPNNTNYFINYIVPGSNILDSVSPLKSLNTMNTTDTIYFNSICNVQQPTSNFIVSPPFQFITYPSKRCGTQMIQFDQTVIDSYSIIFGTHPINSTQPLEITQTDYTIYYYNYKTFESLSQSWESSSIFPDYPATNYTYIKPTCNNAMDGRIVIDDTYNPLLSYILYDEYGNQITYNNVSRSFDNLSIYPYFLTVSIIDPTTQLITCIIGQDGIGMGSDGNGQVASINFTPTLKIKNVCNSNSSGSVLLGASNISNNIKGQVSINGKLYDASSIINLPSGQYQMVIQSLSNNYCVLDQPTTIPFTITQTLIELTQQLTNECDTIKVGVTGGHAPYTFSLYDKNNQLVSNITSNDSQVSFNVTFLGSYQVTVNDASSNCNQLSSITIDKCLVSHATFNHQLSFYLIFIIIIISLLF